jgi:hypothetical protein
MNETEAVRGRITGPVRTKRRFGPDTPVGLPPKCPKCGMRGVLVSRTRKTGRWKCRSWQCRHIWIARNTWPDKRITERKHENE